MNNIQLIHGEALEEMDKLIEQGVVVDSVITDIPYGAVNRASNGLRNLDKGITERLQESYPQPFRPSGQNGVDKTL